MVCTAATIPVFCALPEDPDLYPFLNYPMYDNVQAEGVEVSQFVLVAVFADGTEKALSAEDFEVSSYWFNGSIMNAFQKEDDAKIRQYVAAYQNAGSKPFVALRLDDQPLKITEDGVLPQPTQVVTIFEMTSLTGAEDERK
ncbi:MAG: hypothetical protein WBD47_09965 [Phormidesmis sp.]